MLPPNEFWLGLHALAKTHDAEGISPVNRIANIVDQFSKLPPAAQREFLIALERVSDDLHKLHPLVAEVVRQNANPHNLRIAGTGDSA